MHALLCKNSCTSRALGFAWSEPPKLPPATLCPLALLPPRPAPHRYVLSKEKKSLMLGWILALAVRVEAGAVLEPICFAVRAGRHGGARRRRAALP